MGALNSARACPIPRDGGSFPAAAFTSRSPVPRVAFLACSAASPAYVFLAPGSPPTRDASQPIARGGRAGAVPGCEVVREFCEPAWPGTSFDAFLPSSLPSALPFPGSGESFCPSRSRGPREHVALGLESDFETGSDGLDPVLPVSATFVWTVKICGCLFPMDAAPSLAAWEVFPALSRRFICPLRFTATCGRVLPLLAAGRTPSGPSPTKALHPSSSALPSNNSGWSVRSPHWAGHTLAAPAPSNPGTCARCDEK